MKAGIFRSSVMLMCFLAMGCASSFTETKKPTPEPSRGSMIEKFGFKTAYHFRQTQIDVPEDARIADTPIDDLAEQEIIQLAIKTRILPAILELEKKGLINGFYFIKHEKLDLRLSCDSWEEKEQDIVRILVDNGIPGELTHYSGLKDDDFGNLDDNNLELNSRFVLAYLSILDKSKEEERQVMSRAIPFRWIHYIYNQFGYLNTSEAIHKFRSAFFQLKQGLDHEQCDKETYIKILEDVKSKADGKIREIKEMP